MTDKFSLETYCIDLNDSVAFLSMADIQRLGPSSSLWPKVLKEKNAQKQGGLGNTRPGAPNRVMAARAYAHLLSVGESKACQAAGRWLCTEAGTSSYEYEKLIRRKLNSVDNTEDLAEKPGDRPAFCSVEVKKPSIQEVKEWSFGVRTSTAAVMGRVGKVCEDDGTGWVPIGTGGRCLGETSGDYDILIYNRYGGEDADALIRDLSALSASGRTNLHNVNGSRLLKISDMRIGETLVEVDCVISREGEKAHARVAQQGLFLEKVIVSSGYKFLFQEVKCRAKACGVIDSSGGYLNSYAVILTLFEFLVISRIVTVDKATPLVSQDPICMPYVGLDFSEIAQNYFAWMAEKIVDTEYVFMSFGEALCCKRSLSEFKGTSFPRVCRDPFSFRVDNVMRTVQSPRVKNLTLYLNHSAHCKQTGRHIIETSDFIQRNTFMGYHLEGVLTEAGEDIPLAINTYEGMEECKYTVYIGYPRMSFGLSSEEGDARGRCAMNHLRVAVAHVVVIWGPALISAYGYGGPNLKTIAAHGPEWYCSMTDDTIWAVGMCSMDCNEGEVMAPMDRRSLEILLQTRASDNVTEGGSEVESMD